MFEFDGVHSSKGLQGVLYYIKRLFPISVASAGVKIGAESNTWILTLSEVI